MRTLLITGASSELGQAILADQAGRFDRIAAQYASRPERLDALRERLGDRLTPVRADFTDEADTLRMAAELKEQGFVPTDIVHLPAGRFELKNFPKAPWADYQRDMDISLRSLVLLLQTFLPAMAKARAGRVVVMLSSVTAGVPPKYLAPYVASKYALLGLVKALSAEYAEKGISFNGVSPEMIDTAYLSRVPAVVKELNKKNSPRGRLLSPADVVPVVRLLLDEDAGAVTGQNIVITDGK